MPAIATGALIKLDNPNRVTSSVQYI